MDRAGLQALCKRHGLSAGGSNTDLIARLDVALSQRTAGVEEEVAGVAARKGCLKQTDETKKVTFAVEEGMVRRLRSRVICPPVVPKTMGKSAQAITNYGADDGVFVEVGTDVPVGRSRRNSLGANVPVMRSKRNSLGADVPVRWSRRNSMGTDVPVRQSRRNSLSAEAQDCELRSQVIRLPVVAKTRGKSAQAGSVEVGADVPLRRSRRNLLGAAEAEEVEVAVFVDRKHTRKNQESDECVAVSAQVGASSRVTRRSSLAGVAAVLPPAVEKKRGRGEAAGVQKSAQVEVPARITRSRSIAPVVMSSTVVENKRRKTGDTQTNVELPTISDVPRNDAPVTRSLRNRVVQVNKSVVDANKPATKGPVRGSRRKSVVSELHEKEKDVEKQSIVKQPVRRSSHKSVLPDMLEINIQSGKSEDNEKEHKLKEPIRRSRRSVAMVLLEEQNSGLQEEILSKLPMRRLTRKSVALNAAEKVSMDHTEIVVQSTTSTGRSSKRRRTIASEEMMPVKEANDDMIIREATSDTHKATHEYNKSSSRIQEICQVNATREEFSSRPLLVTVTHTNEICTAQSVHEVIPGSECGDNTKESLDKSKQPKEHHGIQAVDSHLSETRNGELDRSSCIAELVPHNCVVLEGKALISEDGLSIDFTVGDHEEQSPVSREGRVGLEPNATESGEKNLAGVMSTGLYTKSLQHDIDIVAEETGKGDLEKPSLGSAAPECKHECGLPEEIVLPSKNIGSLPNEEQSPFGLESLFSQESIEESEGYGACALVSATTHTENGFGESKDCHVKSGLEKTHVPEPFSHHDTEEGISKNDDCMHTSQQDNGMGDAIENPSICLSTPGYKHEIALSEEAVRTMKENIEESYPHDGLAFPSPEKSGDESINVEVKVHHGSNLCQLGSTDLLDEPIACSNTEVLRQGHNHKNPSNEDRIEQVASEPCTNGDDIVEAAAAATKCIESGVVPLPSEERSNLNDRQLNPKLESPDIMESALNCDKDACNTLDNGSVVAVGKKTPSGSGYYEHNVYQISDICAMSEAAPIGVLETAISVETSSLLDEQLNPELDGDEIEKHSLNCETDTSRILGAGAVMSKTAPLPKYDHTICCQELELSNGLSLFKFAEQSAICQYVSVSGLGICQSRSQKHNEANSSLSNCGTEVLHQDHKEDCDKPNEGKFSPKALVENNMTEDASIEGMESSIMLPLVAGISEIPDEQLNINMSNDSEELSFSGDKDTTENFSTGPAKRDLYPLPKDFHIDSCQKQEVPEVFSLPESAEESAKFQCASVSGSGPCQQRVNESTSMQVTYNIYETLNQCHEECNQNNEDQTTPVIIASSVPEAVEIEVKQSEMEIGLIPAAEASVLPVPDEQLNNKLEGNEVDEHSCSYDTEFLNREAPNLRKDDCKDLCSEDNNRNDLPAPRFPQQSSYFPNDNESGSVGICQSSRRGGIDELRAKRRQSFKVSSTIKGSYIAKSVPRPKPGDRSAVAVRRNRGSATAVKAGHPVKPNADRSAAKDSSRRGLQSIIRGARDDSLSQSAIALPSRNIKNNTTAVKSKANNKPWL